MVLGRRRSVRWRMRGVCHRVEGETVDRRSIARRMLPWLASVAVALVFTVGGPAMAASADGGLSSIILQNALPGMVQEPLGPLNGPLTPSTLQSYLGAGASTNGFDQAISNGSATAYLRMWVTNPPDGQFAEIMAVSLPNSADGGAAMYGVQQGLGGDQIGHFDVPGIPGAVGATTVTSQKGTTASAEMVFFAKGTTLIAVILGQMTTAANPEVSEQAQSQVIQLAQAQAARVSSGFTLFGSNEGWAITLGEYIGIFAGGATAIGVVIYLVVRAGRRRDEAVLAGAPLGAALGPPGSTGSGGPGGPLPFAPGPSGAAGQVGTALLERPRTANPGAFHCAWCGEECPVGSEHNCGTRDTPGRYCMRCGTMFDEGSATCAGCGSHKLQ